MKNGGAGAIRRRLARPWLFTLPPDQAVARFDAAMEQPARAKLNADGAIDCLFALLAAMARQEGVYLETRQWPATLWKDAIQPESTPLPQGSVAIATGGSGGQLRFALHTWQSILSGIEAYQCYFGSQTIHAVNCLPLHHVGGLIPCLRTFFSGGQLLLADWKAIENGLLPAQLPPGAHLSLVPTQLSRVLEQQDALSWLGGAGALLVGGGAAPRELVERALAAGLPLYLAYGMTEAAGTVALAEGRHWLAAGEPAAQLLPHLRARVVEGEIQLAGAGLFSGYWGEEARLGEWYATGDEGRLTAEGQLVVWGKRGRGINTGGEKVAPWFVESALRATGLCEDALVLGLPDAEWGQRVVALVSGCRAEAKVLEQALRESLPAYMCPKAYRKVERIPRNALGKADLEQAAGMFTHPPI